MRSVLVIVLVLVMAPSVPAVGQYYFDDGFHWGLDQWSTTDWDYTIGPACGRSGNVLFKFDSGWANPARKLFSNPFWTEAYLGSSVTVSFLHAVCNDDGSDIWIKVRENDARTIDVGYTYALSSEGWMRYQATFDVTPGSNLQLQIWSVSGLAMDDVRVTSEPLEPGEPPGASATAGPGAGQMRIAWSGAPSGSAPITGYRVYGNSGDANPYRLIATLPSSARSFTESGLPSSHVRWYYVAAVNEYGMGPFAIFSGKTFDPPAPPTGLTAENGPAPWQLRLRWDEPESDLPVTGYHVYRAPDGGEWTHVAQIGTTREWIDQGRALGYWKYKVSAESDAGEGAASQEARILALGVPPPAGEWEIAAEGTTTVRSPRAIEWPQYIDCVRVARGALVFYGDRAVAGAPVESWVNPATPVRATTDCRSTPKDQLG